MVVELSVCSPSTLIIQLQIPLMSTIFIVYNLLHKRNTNGKEAGNGRLLNHFNKFIFSKFVKVDGVVKQKHFCLFLIF